MTSRPSALLLTYRSDEIQPTLAHFLAELERCRLATELPLARFAQSETSAAIRAIFAQQQVRSEFAAALPDPLLRESLLQGFAARLPAPTSGLSAGGRSSQPTPLRAAKQAFDGLTAREREVAALVALGFANRAIAEQLVVSERTVEKHVENAVGKLGFTSRTQLAVWATERGLRS